MRIILLFVLVTAIFKSQGQCPVGQIPSSTNLVINGDFSLGDTGFYSQYATCSTANCLYSDSYYAIGTNANFYHPNFNGKDHTTGNTNFMIINGAQFPNMSMWCQTIRVQVNTQYLFETWVCNLGIGGQARLQFSINGTLLGPVFNAPFLYNSWQRFNATWNSGNDTTATICIVNQNTTAGGNDFGLDDISFRPCECNFSVNTIADTTICYGSSIKLNTTGGATSFQWTSATSVSCDTCAAPLVTPSVTDSFMVTAMLGVCRDSDRVVIHVDSPVDASWTVPPPACAGQQIKLSELLTGTSGGSWSGNGVSSDTLYTTGLDGTYSISYLVNNGTCSDAESHNISIGQSSTLNLFDSICNRSGASYMLPWGTVADSAGVYSHIYTTAEGCDSTVNLTLSFKTTAAVTITAQENIFCANDSSEICAPGGYTTYQWNTGESNNCVWAKNAGNYYLTVTDANGCSAESNRQEMNVFATPPVSIIVQEDTLSSFGATSYQWYFEGAPIPGATSAIYIATQNGVYSLRITDQNGCDATSAGVPIMVTSVENFARLDWAHVYPNPSTGKIKLMVDESLVGKEFLLFTITGRQVYHQQIDNPNAIMDLASLPVAMYWWRVSEWTGKLIIE